MYFEREHKAPPPTAASSVSNSDPEKHFNPITACLDGEIDTDELEALIANLPVHIVPKFLTLEFLSTISIVQCLPLEFVQWYATKYQLLVLDATGDLREPAMFTLGRYNYRFVAGEGLHLALSTLAAGPCQAKLLAALINQDHQPENLQFPHP